MTDSAFIQVVIAWWMLGVTCFGIGAGVSRAAGISRPIGNAVLTTMIGWGALMAAAQATRFFLPMAPWMLGIAMAAAIPGWVDTWRRRRRHRTAPVHVIVGLGWLEATTWLASLSLRAVSNYDTGLYHYDAVRWAQTYPLVPGLANLHDRLGFNSTLFAFAAVIDRAPFFPPAHVVVSGFFAWLWLSWIAIELGRAPGTDHPDIGRFFAIASLPVLIEWAVSDHIPSLGADTAIACFFLVVTGECLRVLTAEARGQRVTVLALALFVATTATTVKPSAIGLLFGVCVLFIAFAAAIRPNDEAIPARRPAWVFVALAGVSLAAWIGGNVVLSGYPLYPSVAAGMPVDWRVPPQMTEAAGLSVRSWARMPGAQFHDYLAGAPWLGQWWSKVPKMETVRLLAAALGATAIVVARWTHGRFPWGMIAGVTPIGVSAIVWFAAAPDLRFSGNAVTILLAAISAFLAMKLQRGRIVVVVMVALITGLPVSWEKSQRLIPHPESWRRGFAPIPIVEFDRKVTDSGVAIAVPAREAQSSWGHALPATYQFNPKLAVRDPTHLGRGFRITDPTSLALGWPWRRYDTATIDHQTYGSFVRGGGARDEHGRYVWFVPPVRMIVYSLTPREARLRFTVAYIATPPTATSIVSVFVNRSGGGEFPLGEGRRVDLKFGLHRGFNEILFAENWGRRPYEFAAVKGSAGTVFGCADYRFTDAATTP